MSLANEVRIGNWVEMEYSKEVRYTTIQPSCFSVNIDKFYLPIPLDEDWLLRIPKEIGEWELDLKEFYFKDFYHTIKLYNNGVFAFCPSTCGDFEIDLKYVHNLQNVIWECLKIEIVFTK